MVAGWGVHWGPWVQEGVRALGMRDIPEEGPGQARITPAFGGAQQGDEKGRTRGQIPGRKVTPEGGVANSGQCPKRSEEATWPGGGLWGSLSEQPQGKA